MKKKVLIVSISVVVVIASYRLWAPLLISIMFCLGGNYTKEGINQYDDADSSVGLCSYLTVREGGKKFLQAHPWRSAGYYFEEEHTFLTERERVILSLSYFPAEYESALEDIRSQPGYSEEIDFDYGDYRFRLNAAERLVFGRSAHTDYCLTGDMPYIEWINLVGECESRSQLVFLGFYYIAGKSIYDGEWEGYPFAGWASFMEEHFRSLLD